MGNGVTMDVFISWSGELSRDYGTALRNWLPDVLQSVSPWMSSQDVDSGTRWTMEIGGKLDQSNDAIVILTPDNLTSPWLNFEAGALAKSVDSSRVRPICFDVSKSQVKNPLAMFQMLDASYDDFLRLVISINAHAGADQLSGDLVTRAFRRTWAELDEKLNQIKVDRASTTAPVIERTEKDLLEEILERVRLAEATSRIRSKGGRGSLSLGELDQKVVSFLLQNPRYRPGVEVDVGQLGSGRILRLSQKDDSLMLIVELTDGRFVNLRLTEALAPPLLVTPLELDEPPF